MPSVAVFLMDARCRPTRVGQSERLQARPQQSSSSSPHPSFMFADIGRVMRAKDAIQDAVRADDQGRGAVAGRRVRRGHLGGCAAPLFIAPRPLDIECPRALGSVNSHGPGSSLIPTNEISCSFGDHNRREIGVGAWDARHDRGVDNAQIVHAVNPARTINHRHWIVSPTNRTCADWMRHWRGCSEQLFIG